MPLRDGDGGGIGEIREGDGTLIGEVRTGEGDVLWTSGPDILAHVWAFDEGNGTTAADSDGDRDGTVNGPAWVSGTMYQGGNALDGGAEDDGNHVNVGNGFDLDGEFAFAFTIAGFTGDTDHRGFLGDHGGQSSGGAPEGVAIRTNDGGGVQLLVTDDTGASALLNTEDTGLIDDGNPHRVVVQKTANGDLINNNVEFHVDGSAEAYVTPWADNTVDTFTGSTPNDLYILATSQDDNTVTGSLGAIMDDVRFNSEALTGSEIQADYDAQPWSGYTIIDSWEAQSLAAYETNTGEYSIVEAATPASAYGLELSGGAHGTCTLETFSGLPTYGQKGDRIVFDFQYDNGGDTAETIRYRVYFCHEDGSNGYWMQMDMNSDQAGLWTIVDGSNSRPDADFSPGFAPNTHYECAIEWDDGSTFGGADGEMTVTITDMDADSQLTQLNGTEPALTGGTGVQFRHQIDDAAYSMSTDHMRVTNR